MFLISLTYTAPEEAVDVHLAAHVAWLKQAMAEGAVLAAGRKVPRTGGLFFLKATDRAQAEAFAALDPFVREGVVTAEITEMTVTMAAPGLEALKA